jgi:hypothetical protein
MNNAHTKIDAAASAKFCGVALVRRLAIGLVVGAAVLSSATAAPGRNDRGGPPQRDAEQSRQYGERGRQFDSREFQARADENRRNLQIQQEQNNQNADSFRRSGRLTPDERRDLRRQINEAGNDIYPNRRNR